MTDHNTKARRKMIKEMAIPKLRYESPSDIIGELKIEMGGKCRLYWDKNDNWHVENNELNEKELNFLQALLIIIGAAIIFVVLLNLAQRAIDIESLQTCEQHNDCSEIIRHINNK